MVTLTGKNMKTARVGSRRARTSQLECGRAFRSRRVELGRLSVALVSRGLTFYHQRDHSSAT